MRRLVWACLVLMLVVTSVSAWLRLAQPRPPCGDWPSCRSVATKASVRATPPAADGAGAMSFARAVHRVAATLVLLLACALSVLAWMRRSSDRAGNADAQALLAVALGLAVLGVITPGSRSPVVLLGNLLGGLAMLALAWRLATGFAAWPPVSAGLSRWARVGTGLWALQAALGAASGAGLLAVAPQLHLALAVVAGPWAYHVGAAACGQGRRIDGAALRVVAVAQFVLGGAAVYSDAPAALVVAHNAGAAIGIALLSGVWRKADPAPAH
jgi:cytochrome c oxidase assembly protein subunit 15